MTGPIDARVEMFHSGAWNTITDDVDMRSPIRIGYGQSDEHGEATPTTLALTLDNSTAKYSPRDPNSALFGKIGLGTKIRVRIGAAQAGMSLNGVEADHASTPDVAALDITGDIDVRAYLEPDTWRPAGDMALARKYLTTGDQRSWAWRVQSTGTVRFGWSTNGTFANVTTIDSTAVIADTSTDLAVRVTLDVDNGATGNDVKFFTAPDLSGPWTQLGATVTTAGVTSIFASTAVLEIGRTTPSGIGTSPLSGRVFAFELRNGIGGTAVANPDFTARAPGDVAFTDAAGRAWTLNGQATITDPSLRASGAIAAFKPSWDETTKDARQSIEAAGILRRLGQGQEPLRSSLFRDLSTKDHVVAYWPMEDGSDATRFASGLGGDSSTLAPTGAVTPAGFDGFVASEPVPTVEAGLIYGTVPAFTASTRQQVTFLCAVPAAGVAADRVLASFRTDGTIVRWDLVLEPDGDMRVRGFDGEGTQVFNTASAFGMNGKLTMLAFRLVQSGQNVTWSLIRFIVGETFGAFFDGTQATVFGRFRSVQLGSTPGMAGTAYGQCFVLNDDIESVWDLISDSLIAWAGERAGDRLVRLAAEDGIPLRVIGDTADTALLGPQTTTELLNLLEDAPAVDLGRFGERRDSEGLLYRTRWDLYNQGPALTLDMDNGVIVNPFDPPLDDQTVRNDVTVARVDGSSFRAVRETGPLSILDPPDGVGGRYKDSQTLNLDSDGQVPDQASWRLHLGTVDEHRIASLEIEMEHHPALQQSMLQLQAGDLIRVTNPPAGLPPGPLDLIALGWSETITPHTWRVTINCAPGSPWTVGVVGDGVIGRADTEDSTTTASFVSGTGTSMTVATNRGPIWTTAAGQFPFDIKVGGVVLTVTAITGAASPQTFTVTQVPVNGVNRTIPAGAVLSLAHPAYVAL